MNDIIKTITTLLGVVALTFSVFFFNENRYTSQNDFVNLEQRVSLNELQRLLQEALENMYFYRKMLRQDPGNEELQEKVKIAEEEVENLKELIKEIKKK